MADIFPARELTGVYNIIYPLVSSSPAIAPIVGGYLSTYIGWRANFVFIFLFGLVLLFLFKSFPETLQKEKRQFLISRILSDYVEVSSSLRFWGLIGIISSMYGSWFIYLTQSPFIFMSHLHFSGNTMGYFYIPLAISVYFGNLVGKKIKTIFGTEMTLNIGCLLFFFGAILLVIYPFHFKFRCLPLEFNSIIS